MSYGYNVVSVKVIQSGTSAGQNVALFNAGTLPTSFLAQQNLNTTFDIYSLSRRQVFSPLVATITATGSAVNTIPIQVAATYTGNPQNLAVSTPGITQNKIFERIALSDAVASIPVTFATNTYNSYSTYYQTTARNLSTRTEFNNSVPAQFPVLNTISINTGTWATSSNSSYYVSQVTVNPVANAVPFFAIRSGTDVQVTGNLYGVTGSAMLAPSTTPFQPIRVATDLTVITANTASQANYSFIPRYTTSTVVNVAPSTYASISSTNQRNLDYWVLKLMYDSPSANLTMAGTATGASFPFTSYTTGGSAAPITVYRQRADNLAAPIRRLMYDTVINGAPYYTTGGNIGNVIYSQTSAKPLSSGFLFTTPFNGGKINFTVLNETSSIVPKSRVDQNLTVQYNLEGSKNSYRSQNIQSYNVRNNVASSSPYDEDISLIPFSVITSTTANYSLAPVNRIQSTFNNVLVKFNASVTTEQAPAITLNRSNIVLQSSSVQSLVRQGGPSRTNYISVNDAGINIISVTIYEPIYGGLTPPISSSGDFGGVQSGVLGYQFWT